MSWLWEKSQYNTGCSVKFEHQMNNKFFLVKVCPLQYLEHTYTEKLIVYINLNLTGYLVSFFPESRDPIWDGIVSRHGI